MAKRSRKNTDPIAWAEAVRDGEIVAGRYVRLAVERHFHDVAAVGVGQVGQAPRHLRDRHVVEQIERDDLEAVRQARGGDRDRPIDRPLIVVEVQVQDVALHVEIVLGSQRPRPAGRGRTLDDQRSLAVNQELLPFLQRENGRQVVGLARHEAG